MDFVCNSGCVGVKHPTEPLLAGTVLEEPKSMPQKLAIRELTERQTNELSRSLKLWRLTRKIGDVNMLPHLHVVCKPIGRLRR